MPYKLDGNCVIKSDTGETVKCHETHEQALAHLRALEANVNDVNKSFQGLIPQSECNYVPLSTVKGKACANCRWFMAEAQDCFICSDDPEPIIATGYCDRWEATPAPPEPEVEPMPVTIVEAPEMEMEMERGFLARIWKQIEARLWPEKRMGAFAVFKDASGVSHWIARYTNNFEDLDSEIISEHALTGDILRKEMGLVPLPELWDWHIPFTKHGQADEVFGLGHFVYAIGHYDDTPLGKAAAAYDSKHADEIELSQGFTAPEWAFKEGIYQVANTFEITKLPKGKAANPFTYFREIQKMEITAERENHLRKVYGDKLVDEIKAQAASHGKALEEMGVAYKDYSEVNPTPSTQTTDAVGNELLMETWKAQGDMATAFAEFLKRQRDERQTLKDAITGYQSQIADLTKEVQGLAALVNAPPRRPSQDTSTVINDPVMKAQAQQQAAVYDDFFGDMKIKKAGV